MVGHMGPRAGEHGGSHGAQGWWALPWAAGTGRGASSPSYMGHMHTRGACIHDGSHAHMCMYMHTCTGRGASSPLRCLRSHGGACEGGAGGRRMAVAREMVGARGRVSGPIGWPRGFTAGVASQLIGWPRGCWGGFTAGVAEASQLGWPRCKWPGRAEAGRAEAFNPLPERPTPPPLSAALASSSLSPPSSTATSVTRQRSTG